MEAANKLEIYEVGPCEDPYQIGYSIGNHFSNLIQSRVLTDSIFNNQLLPFAQSPQACSLLQSLSENNETKFPDYWNEMRGIAHGSGVPFLHIMLLNFRKEILPFVPKMEKVEDEDTIDDCSDVLVVSDTMAVVVHNEDANVALVGHTYLIKATLSNGLSYTAYTYAGELPSCAFGFNNHGLAFTLNSVPPAESEIVAGGIGRNFISRDLLEATSLDDAITRIRSSLVSVGHSYNLIDVNLRRILNVETASSQRLSVHEVESTPFFHANMYLHLEVDQVHDQNSISRQNRADMLPKKSKQDLLSLLGDTDDHKYPIFMQGPTLYTLCTVVIDLDERTLAITEANPRKGEVSYVFTMA
ncbi:putative peptidase C45 [Helianthus debilis subsp. tardiflorus]